MTARPPQPRYKGGTLAAVGVIAFIVGRWSADPETPRRPNAAVATPSSESATPPLVTGGTAEEPMTDHLTPLAEADDDRDASAQTVESVYYRNCSAARAAGAAPIRDGDPGYAGHLDRDGDGVACE